MFRHRSEYPVEGEMPGFEGATAWLNSPPLTPADVQDRVVLVCFGTYTCINWLRSLPYVRAWAGSTPVTGWSSSACRRPSSSSRGISTTSAEASRSSMSGTRLPSTTTTPCGRPSRTTTGRRCTSSMHKVGSATITSAKVSTKDPRWSSRCSSVRPAETSTKPRPHRPGWCRGAGRLGGPWIAGDLPRLRASCWFRLTWRLRAGRGSRLRRRRRRSGEWALSGQWRVGPVPAILSEAGGTVSFQFLA